MELSLLIVVSMFAVECYSQDKVPVPMPIERQCGLNEQYTTCGSACPTTCADLHKGDPDRVCIQVCRVGCECKKGYFRDKDGRCISEAECLANPCNGGVCKPDQTCVHTPIRCITTPCPQYKCTPKLPTHCPSGQPQLPDYFCGRSPDRRDCPPTHYCEISPVDAYAVCCPNKEIDLCAGNNCAKNEKCIPERKHCLFPPCLQFRCEKTKPQDCPLFKCSGDICPNGFAVNKKTGCQDGCNCADSLKCGKNEKLYGCGACDNTCALVRAGDGRLCTKECRGPECGCLPGYARNSKGRCVPESACLKEKSSVCKPNPCNNGERCKPMKKLCKKAPCPQYSCSPKKDNYECPPPRPIAPPPDGCEYVNVKDENGCDDYKLRCADSSLM